MNAVRNDDDNGDDVPVFCHQHPFVVHNYRGLEFRESSETAIK